jgi:hypothetical protein
MKRRLNEQGFALAVSIFALVIVGALVAGAFFVGMQEQRVGRNSIKLSQALAAADAGAYTQIANWNALSYNQMAFGAKTSFGPTWLPNSNGWYRGNIRRMNKLLFLIESEGFSRDSSARQRVGVLTRLRPIELDINAGLETQGEIDLAGRATISGVDVIPPGWSGCPIPTDTLAGVRLPPPPDVDTSGTNVQVVGDPPFEEDPSIDTNSLTTFGDATFNDLRLLATKIIPAGNYSNSIQPNGSATTCNTGLTTNWGEPWTTVLGCVNYFPVIFATGTIVVNGQRGQGVLIVDGDLDVQGGFDFVGPVIVRGTLKLTGSPASPSRFFGGVIAANVTSSDNDLSGNGSISYSFCAIQRALQNGAPAWPLQERSWANLY